MFEVFIVFVGAKSLAPIGANFRVFIVFVKAKGLAPSAANPGYGLKF